MGCADQLPPAGAHSRREKDTLVVHCNATGETSYLTCDGHNWQGEPAKCPAPSKKSKTHITPSSLAHSLLNMAT